MEEIIIALEGLGITLLKEAEPALVEYLKAEGLVIAKQLLIGANNRLVSIKKAAAGAKIFHGKLIDEACVAIEQCVVYALNETIVLLTPPVAQTGATE